LEGIETAPRAVLSSTFRVQSLRRARFARDGCWLWGDGWRLPVGDFPQRGGGFGCGKAPGFTMMRMKAMKKRAQHAAQLHGFFETEVFQWISALSIRWKKIAFSKSAYFRFPKTGSFRLR